MADTKPAKQLFEQLKAAFNKDDLATCKQLIGSIKLELTKLPSLPPLYAPSPNAAEQLQIGRDALELAVLTAGKQGDDIAFERNFAQLRPYYTDCRSMISPSPQESLLVGLNLLRLLVQNRIAEFHTELELVPDTILSSPEVVQVAELEQRLMEGAHHKVLAARGSPASPFYIPYLDRLYTTVRDEVASCSEKAYPSLSITEAQRMLMMNSAAELEGYAREKGWEVVNGRVVFKPTEDSSNGAAVTPVQSMDFINNCLTYAKELERIV